MPNLKVSSSSSCRIDLLKLTVDGTTRYAHSYIGLGLTPVVAVDLEKGGKGSLREMVTTVRAFARFRPFEIVRPDQTRERFDSIVFANINQMAKVATLSEDEGRPDDGTFEVITLRHTAKWRILATALRAASRGLGPQPSVREYAFTTVKPMPLQIDGEVMDLHAGARCASRSQRGRCAPSCEWVRVGPWPTASRTRRAPTCCSTRTTRSTGGSGDRRRSPRRARATCPCCSRSATPRATGAT